MKFVRNFICLLSVAGLFLMMGCSNSVVDSTDISINFNISALKSKTSKVMQNAGSIRALSETESSEVIEAWNTAKLSVALYEVKNAENIPSDYESFDKSLYKEISFSSCYADESGNMTVTLSAVPIGIKAIIVAEISDEQADIQSVEFAGLSNVFEVSDGTNVVELELESCVIDEPVFTLEYKTQTGIVISTQKNIKAGTSIPLPQTINLDELGIRGFGNFLGFYTDSNFTGNPITSVVVDEDITLYAKFEIIYYSITYNIDGATWNNYTPNYSYNVLDAAISYIPKGEDLEKVGYTFEGWYKDADYTEKITSLVGLFEDITLYAKWEVITYSITYELNGGTWADGFNYEKSYTIESAADLVLPTSEHLIKEEFVFDGWYDNAEYNGTAIIKLAGRTGNLTLYARWRDENQVATVQFSEPAGGVDMATEITLSCETEGATIYYSYENKEFSDNWTQYTSDATATSGGITIFADGSTNPVTIYAIAVCDGMENSAVATIEYTLNEYTINLDANGGTLGTSVTSPITVKSGNKVSLLGYTATRTGYTFKGWYEVKNPDFTTPEEVSEFIPSRDNAPNKTKTFYAGWEPITYTVEFDGNGADTSSSMASQEFKYDESKALNQNTFVRTGYTFTGWNIVKNPTDTNPGEYYADKAVVSNLTSADGEGFTLYAQWQPNTASINVTLPTYSDISGLSNPTTNGNNVVFKASGYDSYAWYVNGVNKTNDTSEQFIFDTTSVPGGIYTIMLVVTNSSGNKYSAEWQVTVEK